MRALRLLVALFLLIGEALSQTPFTGQIKGTILTGTQTLREVEWSVEAHGQLFFGKTDADGRFTIDLPALVSDWHAKARMQLVVSFTKPGYEQVIQILDCQSPGQTNCSDLNVKLVPLPDPRGDGSTVTLDQEEIETLEIYYSRKGLTLFILPLDISEEAGEDIATVMLEPWQDAIRTHLQTLPVRPPPQDITPPPDIALKPLSEMEVTLPDTERIQRYGNFLNALAMITGAGSIRQDASGNKVARLVFQYQTIPYREEFQPIRIREIVHHTLPAEELYIDDLFEKVSQQWGFYTLLALSLREVHAFDQAKTGGRVRLERVRAYLIAERSRLRRHELLKKSKLRGCSDWSTAS